MLILLSKAEQKTISATNSNPINNVPSTYGQNTKVEPVPTNVKSTSLDSSSKSYPFNATVILTVSFQISSGSSCTLGVIHLIVVLLTYIPTEFPNLPKLHSIPYYPKVLFPVGIAIMN